MKIKSSIILGRAQRNEQLRRAGRTGSYRSMHSPTTNVDIGISPRKVTSSTRVIESLHCELDELKLEILNHKNRNAELKKANEIVARRRDQLVEQLSNVKHENDTVNSLLQRKERRIASLEEQLNEATCSSDDFKFKVKALETRCSKLQENEAMSVAEYERIKIAYDIMVTSQKEYRGYYNAEIRSLKQKVEAFIKEKDSQMQKNITLINKSDSTIYRSIKSIKLRSREIEEKYTTRDQELLRSMEHLQKTVGLNTQDTQVLLDASRRLLDDVDKMLKLCKMKPLQTNLSEGERLVNPYVTIGTEKDKLEERPKISFSKRDGGLDESEIRAVSVDQRVHLLSKELNSSIPASDRTVTLEPMTSKSTGKSKPIFRSEERSISSEPSEDSRIFSRQLDEVKVSVSFTTTEQTAHHSMIESSPELQEPEVPTGSEGSKKGRRRKKRRAKKAGATSDANEPYANDSS